MSNPIGIFDSGYGGLTIFKEIVSALPQYDYLYLGDNARAPYGTKSFETIYQYTLQSVQWLFDQGCPLVILACNTASAKALRTIQQKDLPAIDPNKKVLGVIRPTSEVIGNYSQSGHVAVLGTTGTIESQSYLIEISKFFPNITVCQQACPEWVSIVENNQINTPEADHYVKRHIDHVLSLDPQIDTILLACTHYPLLIDVIRRYTPERISIISQGNIVANSLIEYLKRHTIIADLCSKNANRAFYTTGNQTDFNHHASMFFGGQIKSNQLILG